MIIVEQQDKANQKEYAVLIDNDREEKDEKLEDY